MRLDGPQGLAGVAVAASIATLAWDGDVLRLPLACAFYRLWACAPNRAWSAAVAASYFLAASRGLPLGIATYYQTDIWPGLLLWLLASLTFISVHALLWTEDTGWRMALRCCSAMIVMALPPLGVLGWAHPITAAGALCPGAGWLGLLLTLVLSTQLSTRFWRPAALALASLWCASCLISEVPPPPPGWRGVDLALGASLGRDLSLRRFAELKTLVQETRRDGDIVVVLPESAFGFWTPSVEQYWRRALDGQRMTVLAGAAILQPSGYDNAIVAVGGQNGVVYRQRIPVPGAMWQPWRGWLDLPGGATANLTGRPLARIAGRDVAPLVCYELLLVWPVLQSIWFEPDILVAVGNGWWTRGTSIVAIQRASAAAWARLFGLPLVQSFNQ
jgi:hypothetical protein